MMPITLIRKFRVERFMGVSVSAYGLVATAIGHGKVLRLSTVEFEPRVEYTVRAIKVAS